MPLAGLEPARIAPLDFESSASANSATAADIKFEVLHELLLIIAYFLPKRKLFLHNVAIESTISASQTVTTKTCCRLPLRSTARKPEATQESITFPCRLPAFLHTIHAVIFTRRQTSSGIPVFRPASQSNLSESPHGGSAQNFRLLSAAPLQNGVFHCNCIPWKIHVLRCRG